MRLMNATGGLKYRAPAVKGTAIACQPDHTQKPSKIVLARVFYCINQ